MAKGPTTRWTMAIGTLAVSAWAMVFELLCRLQERGFISDEEARKIIVGARRALHELRSRSPHASFDSAIEILDGHLRRWRPKKKR